MNKILLIDGHSILNRAYYGLPDLTNAKGQHTNGVLGFLNILFKLMEDEHPTHIFVAFDVHQPTFRHEMYKEYKGTRKGMPEELREQVPILKEVLHAMGITTVEKGGYEADDIIGTMSRMGHAAGYGVTIVSGDRDLLQLATDEILVRVPKTKPSGTVVEDYYAKDVMQKYQVTPTEFIDLKGLMGDASDNIKGVPGIGEKTATKIITEFHSIENAYAHIDEVMPKKAQNNLREYYEQAVFSKKLATIKLDCELPVALEDGRVENLFTEEAYKLFKTLEFKQLLKRFDREETAPAVCEYRVIDDFPLAEETIAKLQNAEELGLYLEGEAGALLALTVAATGLGCFIFLNQGFMTSDWLLRTAKTLLKTGRASVMDLKRMLHQTEMEKEAYFTGMDIGVAAYLMNPLKDSYTYDDIGKDYLDRLLPSRAELLKKQEINLISVREPQVLEYFAYTAQTACDGKSALTEALAAENMRKLYEEIEHPCIFTLYHMERAGVLIDRQALSDYSKMLGTEIAKLENRIYETCGETFNINSPKQLGEILFGKLGLPNGKKTKTGYSTSADVLDKLKVDYPVVQDVLDYRTYSKLKSTYADGLTNYISEDGRIYGTFNQTITATGRISSTEPNLQNIPMRHEFGRQIRKAFIPKEGYVFVDADYSQIELRVMAHMSKDETLLKAYKEGIDVHTSTASEVFDTPLDAVTPLQRRHAKVVNFGIIYGQSAYGLSEELMIPVKEASAYIKKYFEEYPDVKTFLDSSVERAKTTGAVYTLWNRKRPVPEIASSNFMQRSFGERVAMNSPIQGTAADIIKIAMLRVDRALIEKGLSSRLILQIHDELLIEAKEDEVGEVQALLKKEMEEAASLLVPLEIDMHCGKDWYEAK